MKDFVAPRWLEKGGNICQSTQKANNRPLYPTHICVLEQFVDPVLNPLLLTDRADKIKQVTQTNKAQTIGLHTHTSSSSTFSIDKTTRPSGGNWAEGSAQLMFVT